MRQSTARAAGAEFEAISHMLRVEMLHCCVYQPWDVEAIRLEEFLLSYWYSIEILLSKGFCEVIKVFHSLEVSLFNLFSNFIVL